MLDELICFLLIVFFSNFKSIFFVTAMPRLVPKRRSCKKCTTKDKGCLTAALCFIDIYDCTDASLQKIDEATDLSSSLWVFVKTVFMFNIGQMSCEVDKL